MRISLVTPLFKSEPYVEELYQRAVDSITVLTHDYEIVFVNDGSPDKSLEVARRLAARDPRVTVIDLSRNFGQHPALVTGLRAATGDFVFICDSDLEEDPKWIIPFYETMQEKECDVVYGVQTAKKGGLLYRAARRLFYGSLVLLSGIDFPGNITTARLMSRRYLDAMLEYQERELFAAGIWHMVGFDQAPYQVAKQGTSATTYRIGALVSNFVNAITAFSTRPLQVISIAGIVLSATAMVFIGSLLYRKLILNAALEGWTSVMASIMLIGGILLFFNGIIAIYIAKIFVEVKQRPVASVRSVIGGSTDSKYEASRPQRAQQPHPPDPQSYNSIVQHYERCLAEHGDGSRAVDWNSEESAAVRYDVMLDLLSAKSGPVSLLDFGCGLGELKHHIERRGLSHVQYEGLDISQAYADAARERLPGTTIHCVDVLDGAAHLPDYDYIVMNGIFTRRENLSHREMLLYMERLTKRLFENTRRGLAFNVMSTCADWKSDELFHPSFDELAEMICGSLSPQMTLRNDYGLYETTCYVYRKS